MATLLAYMNDLAHFLIKMNTRRFNKFHRCDNSIEYQSQV